MLESLRGHARALASIEPAQLLELSGALRGQGDPVKALYAGNGANLEYIAASVFDGEPQRRTLTTVFPAFIAGGVAKHRTGADMVIVERPPLWSLLGGRIGTIRMAAWARQELHLGGTASRWTLGRHLEREVDRQIRRHDYRLVVSEAAADKRRFFDEFYLPYIRSRHGSGAITVDAAKFASVAANATLAQLFAGERWIAGMLLKWQGDTLRFGWFGSSDNPPVKGASEVLDLLCIKLAAERGARVVNFGNSRPSLKDGVARYKSKFGAQFVLTRYPQTTIEFELGDRAALRTWLSEQQFLCRVDDSLQIVDYSPGNSPSDAPRIRFRPVCEA